MNDGPVSGPDRRTWSLRGVPLTTVLCAVALLAFVANRCLVPMDETDLFYNLRLGEIILHSGKVPTTNLLSFTNPDVPDPNLAWLFQLLLAGCHRAGGIAATVWLKTAFVVATFALLFRVCLRRGAHPGLAALALALSAWAAEPRFVERPHLVTFLGLAALLLTLERAEAGRPRWLYGLIPLGLLWANGNSCFFLAPVQLLLYALGARLEGEERPNARRAALVALALCPLAFATPSGAGVLRYVANHFRMPTLRPLQEYRAAEWPLDGPFFFVVAAVILAGGLTASLGPPPRARRVQLRHLLPLLTFGALGARRIRFVAEFALLAGPYVAAHATELARRVAKRQPGFAGLLSPLTGVALVALVLITTLPRAWQAGPAFDLTIEVGLVPFADIAWVNAHGLRDRLYNDLEVGSYLTWEGWPRHRVFQDPRINGYPEAWHAWLRRSDLRRDEWQAFLERFDVRAALISFPDVNPRAALFDPRRWALVHRSGESLVFARREPSHQAVIAEHELPLTFRYEAAQGVTALPLDPRPPEAAVPDCEWQRRLGHTLVELNASGAADAFERALSAPAGCLSPTERESTLTQAAALALEAGAPERAAGLLDGLTSPAALANRAFALIKLGRAAEALDVFDHALVQAPQNAEASFGRGIALLRLGRAQEATSALRAFIARFPEHFAVPEATRLLGAR